MIFLKRLERKRVLIKVLVKKEDVKSFSKGLDDYVRCSILISERLRLSYHHSKNIVLD